MKTELSRSYHCSYTGSNPWACPHVTSEHRWSCCNSARKNQENLITTWICMDFKRNINIGINDVWPEVCVCESTRTINREASLDSEGCHSTKWRIHSCCPAPEGPTLVRTQHRRLLKKTLHWQQDSHRSFSKPHVPVLLSAQQAKGLTGGLAGRQQQEDIKDLSKKLPNHWQSRRTRRWSEDLTHPPCCTQANLARPSEQVCHESMAV